MSKKRQNDSSKPVGIEDIIKTGSASMMAQEIERLQKLVESQQEYIGNLLTSLNEKELLIQSLQTGNPLDRMQLSDEEIVATIQLRKLKQKAESGELTLDDVRKFDILVKNRRLAQGYATTIEADYKNVLESKPTAALLDIASGKKRG
jgi:hypothetical protein